MNRRTERIGKLMQAAIGRIVMRQLSDPRIDTARTSITRVRVQEDLLRAKVYVSILGTEAEQERGLQALQHAAGRIQALLGKEVALRHMPELDFLVDVQFKGALRTWEIIRKAMDEIRAKEGKPVEENGEEIEEPAVPGEELKDLDSAPEGQEDEE